MKNKIKINDIEKIINEWFQKTIHETVIQKDTVLYNKFHVAKDELISILNKNEQPLEENK